MRTVQCSSGWWGLLAVPPAPTPTPLAYTPPYLAEKILTSRSALEGERKQVTVLFADLKGSMELLAEGIVKLLTLLPQPMT